MRLGSAPPPTACRPGRGQGNGDGEFNLFLTGGTQLGRYSHWISAAGFRLPADHNAENQVFFWSNHLDRQIFSPKFYALTELNWYHWLDSGTAFGLPVEGVDLFNLGSVDVAGNDIVTAAWSFKPERRGRQAKNCQTAVRKSWSSRSAAARDSAEA